MRIQVRSLLKFAGKSERKVAAVFGFAPSECHTAVLHLRKGAPEVPVWLFSREQPFPETSELCERIHVNRSSLALLLQAERQLWPRWVALSVGTWTGQRGKWPLKLAPFLIPPFRALLLNSDQDFFPGTPANIWRHCRRRLRDAAHSGWHRILDLGRAFWLMVSYHIWRSGPVTRVKDMVGAGSLLALATLLRWCFSPHRPVFHWLHGNETLHLPLGLLASDGDRSTSTRWIVWQEQEDGTAGELPDYALPLLADDRTFAVSIQSHFQSWTPALIRTSPFRALQTGEASQVLAPICRTILVDREKLTALGIPRCGSAGTAWLILFWKAAAAGWRSYSLGGRQQAVQQPGMPIQETEFVCRVLSNPALRRLRPQEPDLSRGTVAFSPVRAPAAKPHDDRLRVLIVSPFLPYPLSHGGAVRIYNLCRALAGRVDFILAAVHERNEEVHYRELHEIFQEAYVVDIDEPASADRRLPRQVRQHQSRSLRALIADLSRRWKPDLMQIEYTHMAAFRDSAPEVPAILVEHDLTLSLYRQLAENEPSRAARSEHERWLAFERQWLRAYDGVWTVSGEDCEAAIREGNRRADRTFMVPNGVDLRRFVPCEEAAGGLEVFYVGSFRHLPNIIGFDKLRREIMPRVWSSFPDVRLRVVAGPQHEQFWNRFARKGGLETLDRRIEMHGFVEDLRPFYAGASVVVAPLEVSAGTNIKVLEAMGCGKAIVTTPIGCAGLGLRDGHDAFIRQDAADFAHAVCDLLSEAGLRTRMGAQARRSAEERFSWTAIADRAYESYLAVARAVTSPVPQHADR
jgi:glycosyltransferase involved in cell wall biosynthesis